MTYQELKPRLAKSKFRSRFRLSDKDRIYLAEKGMNAVKAQARKILLERLAPALPRNDGKQTPIRGHPVFPAQHATGCCCRGCLAKWHGIPAGRALTDKEIDDLVTILMDWIADHAGDLSQFPQTPDLF